MDALGRFTDIFDKGDNLYGFLFIFLYTRRKQGLILKAKVASQREHILSFSVKESISSHR